MTDLNELFDQILHSEQKCKARVDELRLVGVKVEKCQCFIHQVREAIQHNRGELAVKMNKRADQEAETQIFQIRKEILTRQRDTLYEAKQIDSQKTLDAENKYESEQAEFIDDLTKFSQYYDLLGSGGRHRDKDLKKKQALLQDEILLLEAELVEIQCQQEERNKYQFVLTETENKLLDTSDELAKLTKAEEDTKKEIVALDREKVLMDQSLCQEPEFVRLQRELESCKVSTGDMICQQLSEEQDELQRQYYHKQMKQQMTDKKIDTQHSTTSSSRSSGHYNPYTLRYIPAPNPEEPPTSTMDTMETLTIVGDDDSATVWGMEVDEDDITLSDSEVFQEAINVTAKVQKSAAKKQLPPSNFTKLPSVITSNNDFKRASSSVSNQQSTTTTKQSTVAKRPTAASGSKVTIFPLRNHLLKPSVKSPQPEQIPKSRGISNFRPAGAQDSELPRGAKKVRFHY